MPRSKAAVKRLSVDKTTLTSMKKSKASEKKEQHWSLGLLASMNDPEAKLEEDDVTVVIRDKYPKARHHVLVLPKKHISDISKVTKDDLELLRHMEALAKNYTSLHKDYEFQIGYHAIPSMQRLHLHVISTDFDSRCLKTQHHWNTFTTPYFIPSEDVCKQLEDNGKIQINRSENLAYLKRDLKCHKCQYVPKSMPDLKRHILQHAPPIK